MSIKVAALFWEEEHRFAVVLLVLVPGAVKRQPDRAFGIVFHVETDALRLRQQGGGNGAAGPFEKEAFRAAVVDHQLPVLNQAAGGRIADLLVIRPETGPLVHVAGRIPALEALDLHDMD